MACEKYGNEVVFERMKGWAKFVDEKCTDSQFMEFVMMTGHMAGQHKQELEAGTKVRDSGRKTTYRDAAAGMNKGSSNGSGSSSSSRGSRGSSREAKKTNSWARTGETAAGTSRQQPVQSWVHKSVYITLQDRDATTTITELQAKEYARNFGTIRSCRQSLNGRGFIVQFTSSKAAHEAAKQRRAKGFYIRRTVPSQDHRVEMQIQVPAGKDVKDVTAAALRIQLQQSVAGVKRVIFLRPDVALVEVDPAYKVAVKTFIESVKVLQVDNIIIEIQIAEEGQRDKDEAENATGSADDEASSKSQAKRKPGTHSSQEDAAPTVEPDEATTASLTGKQKRPRTEKPSSPDDGNSPGEPPPQTDDQPQYDDPDVLHTGDSDDDITVPPQQTTSENDGQPVDRH